MQKAVLLGYGLTGMEEVKALGAGRVYVGHEFCERLLPRSDEFLRTLAEAGKHGFEVTLVTPMLTESGIKKFRKFMGEIRDAGVSGLEVVINGWGVCQVLEDFPEFQRILGRTVYSCFPNAFVEFLVSKRITAVEFNCWKSLNNFGPKIVANGIKRHLVYPFMNLTSTRYCSSVNVSEKNSRDAIESCAKECLEVWGSVKYSSEIGLGLSSALEPGLQKFVLPGSILVRGNAWMTKLRSIQSGPGFELERLVLNHCYFKDAGGEIGRVEGM